MSTGLGPALDPQNFNLILSTGLDPCTLFGLDMQITALPARASWRQMRFLDCFTRPARQKSPDPSHCETLPMPLTSISISMASTPSIETPRGKHRESWASSVSLGLGSASFTDSLQRDLRRGTTISGRSGNILAYHGHYSIVIVLHLSLVWA